MAQSELSLFTTSRLAETWLPPDAESTSRWHQRDAMSQAAVSLKAVGLKLRSGNILITRCLKICLRCQNVRNKISPKRALVAQPWDAAVWMDLRYRDTSGLLLTPEKQHLGTCTYIILLRYLTRALEQPEKQGKKSCSASQDVECKVKGEGGLLFTSSTRDNYCFYTICKLCSEL